MILMREGDMIGQGECYFLAPPKKNNSEGIALK